MADLSVVSSALETAIANIAYPNGTSQPSVINANVYVYGGWAIPEKLMAHLNAGSCDVSIFPKDGDKITWIGAGDVVPVSTNTDGSVNTTQSIRKQIKSFQISVWANCFQSRDSLAGLIDAGLANIHNLILSDGSICALRFVGSHQIDNEQSQGVYRRDLIYSVEFSTDISAKYYPISQVNINMNSATNSQLITINDVNINLGQ